jgi:hypothetical protein
MICCASWYISVSAECSWKWLSTWIQFKLFDTSSTHLNCQAEGPIWLLHYPVVPVCRPTVGLTDKAMNSSARLRVSFGLFSPASKLEYLRYYLCADQQQSLLSRWWIAVLKLASVKGPGLYLRGWMVMRASKVVRWRWISSSVTKWWCFFY